MPPKQMLDVQQLMTGSAGRFPGDLYYRSTAGDKDEWSRIDLLVLKAINSTAWIFAVF